ncbi:hypothetical protein ElyMa_003946500 [Elysia marginata]|uniref:Sema domain-containing protein n=1 Tax=Elysia marginata TaxID=1093978 RepID=A0AAV4FSY5_9GAST|nr:hypothetical protein ElyMa_003946500 [Elysia marginata]
MGAAVRCDKEQIHLTDGIEKSPTMMYYVTARRQCARLGSTAPVPESSLLPDVTDQLELHQTTGHAASVAAAGYQARGGRHL